MRPADPANLVAMALQILECLGITGRFIVVCTVNLVLILTVICNVAVITPVPTHAATSSDSESTDPTSDLGGSSGNHVAGDGRQEHALRQLAPGWRRVWKNLEEPLSPPMAWHFLPEQAYNPAEMEDPLKEGCLVYVKKRELVLMMFWGLAYTYQACIQHPQRSWSDPGSEGIQMDIGAKPETQDRSLLLMVGYPFKDDLVDYRGKCTTLSVI
ncbi:hypothetical protein llap_2902 [Limosa lapponica baueri]|uniref:Uncharacterized protein n=1 Tax=Limosa lapponica baueri TaxID=1758121 RepID=A0A2I0ULC6_LIMLA|nr:hypothetical protein llap_2902 [Limosa lapponica baueri]